MTKLVIVIVFLTLLGASNIIFEFIPPFYYYYHLHYNVSAQAFFIRFIFALLLPSLLTAVLVRSISFAEKAEDSGYTFGKILRRDWWEIPPIFISILGLSCFLDITFGGHPGLTPFTLILGLPIAFIAVILFSIIPSHIYLRFSNNRTASLTGFGILLFISLAIIYYSLPPFTCRSASDYICLAQKNGDPSFCEKFDWQGDKNNCYVSFSKRSGDATVCEKVVPQDWSGNGVSRKDRSRYQCIVNVAKNSNNAKLCESLPKDYVFYERFYHITDGRIENGGYKTCHSFSEL